jgi:hypothetical protein
MDTQNFIVNYRTETKTIEYFTAESPDVGWTVFAKALFVKTIHLGDLPWFMISSDKSDSIWVSYFQSQ